MAPNSQMKKALKIASIVTPILAVLLVVDTAQVAMAAFELRKALSEGPAVPALISDIEAGRRCGGMISEEGHYQQAWRDCYLSTMAEAKSVKGAYINTMRARGWLDANPRDDEVRARAVRVIEAGWAAHLANEPLYVVHEKFERAANRSALLVLLHGGRNLHLTRTLDARMLEQAELAIAAPELFKKQARRTMELAITRKGLSSTAR